MAWPPEVGDQWTTQKGWVYEVVTVDEDRKEAWLAPQGERIGLGDLVVPEDEWDDLEGAWEAV